MKTPPPPRVLGDHPDSDQLRLQAKELLASFLAGEPGAVAEVNAYCRVESPPNFALHDAQFVLARAYGFDGWPQLKARVDGVTVRRLAEAVRAGDIEQTRAMLKVRPELVSMDMAFEDEHQVLHYAVYIGSPEMVRLLMQHGASAQKGVWPHRNATTPRAIATDRGLDEIVSIIEEEERRRELQRTAGPKVETPAHAALTEAFRTGDEASMVAMLEADPSLIDGHRRPLHAAACMLWERFAGWLLDRGYDVNWMDEAGWPPLT